MMTLEVPDQPIPNSYWVVPGRFAAGEYPGDLDASQAASKLRALLSAGIDHFVDLTEPDELLPYADIARDEASSLGADITHERLPVRDVNVPRGSDEMTAILDAIDDALDAARPCTSTVGVAWAEPARSSAVGWCDTGGRATRRWNSSRSGRAESRRRTADRIRRRRPSSSDTSANGRSPIEKRDE